MKLILAFSTAAFFAVVSGQPEFPVCVIDSDTTACVTPFGEPGYFVCPVFDGTMPPFLRGVRPGKGPGMSRSMCAPVNPPEITLDGEGPFGGAGPVDGNFPIPTLECGCCDGVCPSSLGDCACPCDITLPYNTIMKGVKATVVKPDGTTVSKCLPPAYADADKATCVQDCSVEVETAFPFF